MTQLIGDLEVAVEKLQPERASEAVPAIGRLRGRGARESRLASIRFFVAIPDGELVLTILARLRDDVVQRIFLEPLRVLDLAAELVTAVVDPAALDAEFHTGAGVRTDEGFRGVDRLLCRYE